MQSRLEQEHPRSASALVEQTNRIRQALFVYLKIILDNVPAWSDFWKSKTWIPSDHGSPLSLRQSTKALDEFDTDLDALHKKAKQRMDAWCARNEARHNAAEDESSDSEAGVDDDTVLIQNLLRDIVAGNTLRPEAEEVIEELKSYRTRLLAVVDCLDILVKHELDLLDGRTHCNDLITNVENCLQKLDDELGKQIDYKDSEAGRKIIEGHIVNADRIVLEADEILRVICPALQKFVNRGESEEEGEEGEEGSMSGSPGP